jgi:hypothetical protein
LAICNNTAPSALRVEFAVEVQLFAVERANRSGVQRDFDDRRRSHGERIRVEVTAGQMLAERQPLGRRRSVLREDLAECDDLVLGRLVRIPRRMVRFTKQRLVHENEVLVAGECGVDPQIERDLICLLFLLRRVQRLKREQAPTLQARPIEAIAGRGGLRAKRQMLDRPVARVGPNQLPFARAEQTPLHIDLSFQGRKLRRTFVREGRGKLLPLLADSLQKRG